MISGYLHQLALIQDHEKSEGQYQSARIRSTPGCQRRSSTPPTRPSRPSTSAAHLPPSCAVSAARSDAPASGSNPSHPGQSAPASGDGNM